MAAVSSPNTNERPLNVAVIRTSDDDDDADFEENVIAEGNGNDTLAAHVVTIISDEERVQRGIRRRNAKTRKRNNMYVITHVGNKERRVRKVGSTESADINDPDYDPLSVTTS